MSIVDNRIVQMMFDNKAFEKGVETSLNTLEKLKKGLDLSGSAKGLENLDKVSKSFSVASIAEGVDSISKKFTALGIIGITALQNITNSAINAGKRIASAFTIDPIKSGFQEYETQINAVQTILANTDSKGTTLEQVNKALATLNKYADDTIYNFTEMTRNIGTFTAAGVDLDTSVSAIKGIANLAAVSGSTSQQASTAMYQLSQALASGTVKLQDWNSVVNAGMGGDVFQTALKETARLHGVSIDKMIKTEGSFRETLSEGWLTSEILTETLSKFTGDLNAEQLKTMGYTEDQIKGILKMGAMANDAATKVKTFTQLFDTLKEAAQSGWTQTWETIVGDFEEAKSLLTNISDALGGIIGDAADARNAVVSSWKNLGGRTVLIAAVEKAFKSLSDIVGVVKSAFREIFPPITGRQLMDLTVGLLNLTRKFELSSTTLANLKSTFKGFFAVLDIGKEALFAIFKALSSAVGYFLPMSNGLLSMSGSMGEFLVSLRDTIKESNIFNRVFETLGSVIVPVAEAIKRGIDKIMKSLSRFTPDKTKNVDEFGNRIEKSFSPFTFIANVVKKAFDIIEQVVAKSGPVLLNFASAIGKGLGSAAKHISEWASTLSFGQGLDIFNAGMFGAILLGLKKFMNSLTGVTSEGPGILNSIKTIIGGVSGIFGELQANLKADTLMKIAGAIAILAVSLVVLSMIDANKLGVALLAISTLFLELFASMAIFQKVMGSNGFKGMIKLTGSMIALSIAVLLLSVAMKSLASLSWSELLVGMTGLAVLLAMTVATAKGMSTFSGPLAKGAGSLILFAVAINVLVSAVRKLGEMQPEVMTQGLIGVGSLLAGLLIFIKATNVDSMSGFKSVGILLLAVALNILSIAVRKIGELDTAVMIQGLIGLGVLLTELGIFLNMTGDVSKVMSTAVGLTILAGAMILMSIAIDKFGSMDTGQLTQGLIALAASLTIIAVALHFMQGAMGGAAALLVVAGALAILAPSLERLGNMSLAEIAKGLLALVGVFAVLGLAGLVLAPIVPIILSLAASIVLLGAGMALIGGGVALLAAGFAALAISVGGGVGALVLAITAIIGLIPMFLEQIARSIVAMAKIIGDGASTIVEAAVKIIVALADGIIAIAPKLAEAIVVVLYAILNAVEAVAPKIGESIILIFVGIFKGLIKAVKDLLGIKSPSTVFKEIATNTMLGLINGIKEKISDVATWAGNIATTLIDGVKNVATNFVGIGKDVVGGLVTGMKGKLKDVGTWAGNLGKAAINGAREMLDSHSDARTFIDIGIDTAGGFITGMRKRESHVYGGGEKLGEKAIVGTTAAVKKNAPKAKKAVGEVAKSLFEETQKWIDRQRKYFELSLEDEYAKWESIQNKYKTGSDERLDIEKRMSDIRKDIKKKEYDYSMSWIDEEKHYKRLSLDEELAAWLRVQDRYAKGSEERISIDRKVFTLRNDLTKESYQASLDWIEEEKYYNRLSLEEELAAWERVQSRYVKGTEERKKLDREVYRVRKSLMDRQLQADEEYARDSLAITEKLAQDTKALDEQYAQDKERIESNRIDKLKELDDEYYRNSKDINNKLISDVKALEDAYNNAVTSRTKTLFNAYGLFDKVKISDDPITGEQLLGNLEGQIKAFDEWKTNLYKLQERGFGEELISELEQMGPQSLEQINALNQLTDEELSKYSTLWGTKHEQAKIQATHELENLRIDTQTQIGMLRAETAIELQLLTSTWIEQTTAINLEVEQKLLQLRETYDMEMDYLNVSTTEKLNELKNIWEGKTTEIAQQVLTEFAGMSDNVIVATKDMKEGTVSEINDMGVQLLGSTTQLSSDMKAQHTGLAASIISIWKNVDWAGVGLAIVRGIQAGVAASSGGLIKQMTSLALSALAAAKSALGIRSPSKRFREIGEFMIEGLIQGLNAGTSDVTNALTSIFGDDEDLNPVIRPVLDLSEIVKGKKELALILGNNKTTDLARSISKTSRLDINSPLLTPGNTELKFVQNNYSPKSLSRVDIYRQTKNQISTMKGVLETL